MAPTVDELRQSALHRLKENDVAAKAQGVAELAQRWSDGQVGLDAGAKLQPTGRIPGRPAKPVLVPPGALKHRGVQTPEGRAVLIHALAHIEFNAINLALDAIWRFPDMPPDYYADWLQVAAEEALHFSLLSGHLRTLNHEYGDFPAHNGLWEMAERTGESLLARLALIPRTMEARGLDVSPGIRDKLLQARDTEAAAILDIILRDEIGHVAIGNRWFHWLCGQQGMEPLATYAGLIREYDMPAMRGPFNLDARRAAGFSEAELHELAQSEAAPQV